MTNKEKIINEVIDQIKYDLKIGDYTAIEELLKNCTKKELISFLPEIDQKKLKNDKK